MELTLNLLVLRCKDVEVTRPFYEQLGMEFTKEKHGAGPHHYTCESPRLVLELYPITDDQTPDMVRLGFSTPWLADVFAKVRDSSEITMLKAPHASGERLIMLLQDPDGRTVEISQALHH